MGRPTKYNQEVADRLILFIEQGLTVKDACYGVNISPDTCSRWRQKYPEFAEKFMEASKKQLWGSADALARYHHYRPYRRKVGVCLPAREKPRREPLRSSQDYFRGRGSSDTGSDEVDDDFLPIVVI